MKQPTQKLTTSVRRLSLGLMLLIAGVLANNWAVLHWADPMGAVLAEVERQGGSAQEWVPLEGGYSSRLIGWTAHGRYRRKGAPSEEIAVKLRKPSVFHPWQLAEYRRGKR